MPAFGTVTPTSDGFTVEITNHDAGVNAGFAWSLRDRLPDGSAASIDPATGVLTVSAVDPGTDASVIVETRQDGHAVGSRTANGRSINGAALTPTFVDETPTADGFTVRIDNFGPNDPYTWAVDAFAPDGSAVDLDQATGVVTVTRVAADTAASVTIRTTRRGYDDGTATATSRSLKAALVPTFAEDLTRTPDGFTVTVDNYLTNGNDTWYNWRVEDPDDQGPIQAAIARGSGLLTVTGVRPDSLATITVTTTRPGHAEGSAVTEGRSLKAALPPAIGTPTRTAGGFTVPLENWASDDPYNWGVSVAPNGNASLDPETGIVTVTGLDDGAEGTVTVTTTRDEHAEGTATRSGFALDAARTPEWGDRTRTADGFRVQITNHTGQFTWGAQSTRGTATVSGSGLVTVSGLDPDMSADVTVTTTRTGHINGQATTGGTALSAARVPAFGSPARGADGFTLPLTNYDADFHWVVTASNTDDEVSIDDSGTVMVTGLAPGEESVVRIRTTRDGHADGEAQTTVAARSGDALTPQFGPVTSTASGFTVRIVNHLSSFAWSATPSAGSASVDSSGTVTVTGLSAGQTATVRVTSTRAGYGTGSGDVSGAALPAKPTVPAPPSVPAAPTISATKPGATKIDITWIAGNNGGSPITRATATCRSRSGDQVRTVSGTQATLTVSKLKKATRYRCSVSAANAVGTSVESAVKNVKTTSKSAKSKKKKSKAQATATQRQNGSTS